MTNKPTAVPGAYPGETWDAVKGPVTDRISALFDALNSLGTQEETEPLRCTLRVLLCNRGTLAQELESVRGQLLETQLELARLKLAVLEVPDHA